MRLALAAPLLAATASLAQAAEPGRGVVGAPFTHVVGPGDSLHAVSARHGIGVAVLAPENGLSTEAGLRVGQELRVDARHVVPGGLADGILINVPQRMLFLLRGGQLALAFPVGLGKPSWPTPTGDFSVREKAEFKAWLVPRSIQEEMCREGREVVDHVDPGPENPLGRYWIGLSLWGYGIHSTTAPHSVYRFRSHGCIRVHEDDVAALFAQVEPGEPGRLVYEPVLFAATEEGVFLESHRDVYGKGAPDLEAVRALARDAGALERVDWDLASRVLAARDGIARDVTQRSAPPRR